MIISKQNSFIKEIKSLSNKKFRDSLNLYLAEGVKLIKDALSAGANVKAIVLTEQTEGLFGEFNGRKEIVSDSVFKSITTEITPQGAIAVIEKPIQDVSEAFEQCVFLDGVSDPANVGAIIRTAAASGYSTVYYTPDSADPFSPKSVRASMGGIFRVKTIKISAEDFIKNNNVPIIVADMQGVNVFENLALKSFCLVIGNEGNGVSPVMRNNASKSVSIPMQNGMESLNASVSAGILMYLLKR